MLKGLYKNRFSPQDIKQKDRIWKVLCSDFFQDYVGRDSIVLDIGAGYGEFINNIYCKEKYALDLNDEVVNFLNPDVKFFRQCASELSFLKDGLIDVVFMSNVLEHLKSKEDVLQVLSEAKSVLKTGGRLIILGPNIRYAYKEYWDFFDHSIPISDKSLIELLNMLGFRLERIIPRFLPYTTKTIIFRCPPCLIKVYLKMPLLWRLLGKQLLLVAKKS